MYFLVEQYRYEVSDLNDVFGDILSNENITLKTFSGDSLTYSTYNNGTYVKFDHVGYCHYSFKKEDGTSEDNWIFFLPKVVLDCEIEEDPDEGDEEFTSMDAKEIKAIQRSKSAKILKLYNPSEYILADRIKTKSLEDYIYLLQLSVSVSRAIGVYNKKCTEKDNKTILKKQAISNIHAELNGRPQSFLDVLDSLDKFARENQDYFMFLAQESHNPQKRINWAKTIQNISPIFKNKRPFYINPITTKKEVDFDEELLVLFYSILNFINETFQYNCPINEGYNLIQGAQFIHYLNGVGHNRLQQIRYKYYTDKALTLWKLCDEFFIHSEASHDSIKEEYILAKGFHKVFEGIMDRLISDPKYARYKKLRDGKIIDHLYCDKSLINPSCNILYVADSKYYAINATIGVESRTKQFTYASGIQNEWINKSSYRFMDADTHGYDIIPNYLISAKIPESRQRRMSTLLEPDKTFNGEKVHMSHVDNTLFAGSTKYIFKFSVDFKYVTDLYSRNNEREIDSFKESAHKIARDFAIKFYDGLFRFFWFTKLPKAHKSEKDLLVLDYKAGSTKGLPAFLIMVGRVYSFAVEDRKQYVVAVSREERQDFGENYKNESKAIVDSLLAEDYIHRINGVIVEEHKLSEI